MARSIAKSSLYPTEGQLEAKLKALENRYDKDTAHYRRYHSDLKDIEQLLKHGKIDKGHAQALVSSAEKTFNQAQGKARKAKGLRSHPAYPLPPRQPKGSWFKRVFGD